MAKVVAFPGVSVTEVTIPEPEPAKPACDPIIVDLLMRYQDLGAEIIRQHSSTLSFDLHLEIDELRRLVDEILDC